MSDRPRGHPPHPLRHAAGLALALLAGVGASAQDLPVAASDELLLRVLDWDALTGEVVEWPEISGAYVVGPDGTIAVPFAGRIQSEGRWPDDIAADVIEGLRNRLALVEPPDATVEVAVRRPVIVTGDVRTPGPIPFTPGLLATQAIGLAGGTGSSLSDDAYLRREVAATQTTLSTLRSQERRQIARQARLEAELAGETSIVVAVPPAGVDWPWILALEEQLLRLRRDRLQRELAAIDEQDALLVAEIDSLERKEVTLTEQLALATQAAANAEALASQGLVANQRLFESGQVRAGIENQLLDVSTAILRARQGIASADRERIGLQDARASDILEQRQDVDGRLAETQARIGGEIALLQALDSSETQLVELEPEVTILRLEAGVLNRIEDAALLPLLPGDMVEVREIAPVRTFADPAVAAVGTAIAPEPTAPASAPAQALPVPEPVPQPLPVLVPPVDVQQPPSVSDVEALSSGPDTAPPATAEAPPPPASAVTRSDADLRVEAVVDEAPVEAPEPVEESAPAEAAYDPLLQPMSVPPSVTPQARPG